MQLLLIYTLQDAQPVGITEAQSFPGRLLVEARCLSYSQITSSPIRYSAAGPMLDVQWLFSRESIQAVEGHHAGWSLTSLFVEGPLSHYISGLVAGRIFRHFF